MRLNRWLASGAAVAVAALVTACVPSVHPFYTEASLASDPDLEGSWAEPGKETEKWRFSREGGGGKGFRLVFTDEQGREGAFAAHLFDLEGGRFLDLFPEEPKEIGNEFYKYHLLPTHTLMRVARDGDTLNLAVHNPRWVDDHLKANPDALAHERTEGRLVLTASTAELQDFLREHAESPEFFGDPFTLKRRKED